MSVPSSYYLLQYAAAVKRQRDAESAAYESEMERLRTLQREHARLRTAIRSEERRTLLIASGDWRQP